MERDGAAAIVLVTVGTDHHPFRRLVAWADHYVHSRPEGEIDLVCQHGTADPPSSGAHHPWVEHDELQRLIHRSTAIVCHGGPSTVLEILRSGRIPIVVPRRQHLGEAIDDHQVEFCQFLLRRREVVVADTERELHDALDLARSDPSAFVAPQSSFGSSSSASRESSVSRFADLASRLVPRRRARLLRRIR